MPIYLVGGGVAAARSLDPRYMEDEEYTEWIRTGMHRYGLLVVR